MKNGKKGFTLAETLIVLVVLGIIAAMTIPSIIAKQVEASKRTKIKKSMTVYDYAVNKMVVENNLKSDDALLEWAGEDCSNSAAYFKISEKLSEDTSCVFRAPDGLYWDITDIENPIVAQTEDDLNKMQNGEDAGTNAFRLSAWFDEKGSLRVNDLNSATDTKDELTRLYNYIYNKKVETTDSLQCYTIMASCYNDDECEYEMYIGPNFDTATAIYSGCDENGNNCSESEISEYDKNGNMIADKWGCDINGENCSGSYKYEYDKNGNLTAEYWGCDESGKNCNVDSSSKYDSKGRQIYFGWNCNTIDDCTEYEKYEYDDEKNTMLSQRYKNGVPDHRYSGNAILYEYDEKGRVIAETQGTDSTFYNGNRYVYTYDDKDRVISKIWYGGWNLPGAEKSMKKDFIAQQLIPMMVTVTDY